MDSNRKPISKIIKIHTTDIVKTALIYKEDVRNAIEILMLEKGINIHKEFQIYFDTSENAYIVMQ